MSESSNEDSASATKAMSYSATENGPGHRFLYDVDGVVPYSIYEKKPELYDVDGKHGYKYFSQLKALEKFDKTLYDDVDGKVNYRFFDAKRDAQRFKSAK